MTALAIIAGLVAYGTVGAFVLVHELRLTFTYKYRLKSDRGLAELGAYATALTWPARVVVLIFERCHAALMRRLAPPLESPIDGPATYRDKPEKKP